MFLSFPLIRNSVDLLHHPLYVHLSLMPVSSSSLKLYLHDYSSAKVLCNWVKLKFTGLFLLPSSFLTSLTLACFASSSPPNVICACCVCVCVYVCTYIFLLTLHSRCKVLSFGSVYSLCLSLNYN